MSLALVTPGSVVESVYHSVPTAHGAGPRFGSREEAVAAAREAWLEANDRSPELMVEPLVTVALRWRVAHPRSEGGAVSSDLEVERVTLPVLDVVEVLSRHGVTDAWLAERRARSLGPGHRVLWDHSASEFTVARVRELGERPSAMAAAPAPHGHERPRPETPWLPFAPPEAGDVED